LLVARSRKTDGRRNRRIAAAPRLDEPSAARSSPAAPKPEVVDAMPTTAPLEVRLDPAADQALRQLAALNGCEATDVLRDAVRCILFAHGDLARHGDAAHPLRKPRTLRRPATWAELERARAELLAERQRLDGVLGELRQAMLAKSRYRRHQPLWDAVLYGLVRASSLTRPTL
jgi:multidrug efflux pump subunit AcrA (membrane-fusion protein)